MGIQNALTLLEEEATANAELISMARRNAERLNRTLLALLDLAALESGSFHARLREVDLSRLVRSRIEAARGQLHDAGVGVEFAGPNQTVSAPAMGSWSGPGDIALAVLADPQKLGRVIELCVDSILPRVAQGSTIKVRISSTVVVLTFQLADGAQSAWESAWSHGLAGFHGGLASPGSAFGGVLQSEEAFLSRMEEGLGSEFILAHQIMRLHNGTLESVIKNGGVQLVLTLPELDSEEGIKKILASRIEAASLLHGALGSVAIGLLEVPAGEEVGAFRARVKERLFRASDSVYSLPALRAVAVLMDDCRPEDAPKVVARIQQELGTESSSGIAVYPEDGHDSLHLLLLAQKRLAS